jgi:hypothetical protein
VHRIGDVVGPVHKLGLNGALVRLEPDAGEVERELFMPVGSLLVRLVRVSRISEPGVLEHPVQGRGSQVEPPVRSVA